MKHTINTICLLAVLLVTGSTAFAQIHKMERSDSAAESRIHQMNPVVVTGSGHHQRLKATATPVHVLSAQEIREQGITTFDAALTRMMPQISMAPNSMGSQLRLNGLGNKYILILINGQKLSGDISNNVDLNRINMSRVKRIEVLDGAASSLYGSDAIAGVINIITDQPTQNLISVGSDTRVSGHGVLTENVTLDIYKNGFGSYTSFSHDRADSYRNNPLEYKKGSDTETQTSIAPLFTGYRANVLGQKFTYAPNEHLALNAGIDGSYKITDRPNTVTVPDGSPSGQVPVGGTDYEMRYKGLRWNVGGIYKFTPRNSLQADFTVDRFRYGKEYDVDNVASGFAVGDYVQSKKQRTMEGNLKAILGLTTSSTTIVGADWRQDYLMATSGNIDTRVYTLAAYAQHEQKLLRDLTATIGLRLTHHETFHQHLTPKATLMYAPGHFRFRATYSAGFRAPGLDELYYHYFSVNRGKAQISFGNKDLKPEKSHYFALNAEYRTQVIAVSLTGYINRINDMVVKQNIDVDDRTRQMLLAEFPEMTQEQADKMVSYARYQNSDKGDVKGLQLNISANLLRGFNLSANYAYTHARSCTVPDGTSVGATAPSTWQPLDRSIRHTATLAANYRHTWNRYTLNVNLNGRLQSKTYYTGSYEDAPGYGVWNLHTTHAFQFNNEKLIVQSLVPSIGIDNLFDKVDRRIDSSTRKYALYSPGLMLVVGLKVKFKQ
ncbi:MAG: TonB-dependent receptor [Bacteroidaceae bacterium]|nr:TonB-dependent receptor [Bacteroidaceae bacterium]